MENARDLVDDVGRPLDLSHRLSVYINILKDEYLPVTKEVLHTMLWWDDTLSKILDENNFYDFKWSDSNEGPSSSVFLQKFDEMLQNGHIFRKPEVPVAREFLDIDEKTKKIGENILKLPIFEFSNNIVNPWYYLIKSVVSGVVREENGTSRVSRFYFPRDVELIRRIDPVYKLDKWRSEGPGKAETIYGGVTIQDNFAIKNIKEYMKKVPDNYRETPGVFIVSSGYLWGDALAKAASETKHKFGDKQFLNIYKKMVISETRKGNIVSASFRYEGKKIGFAQWEVHNEGKIISGAREVFLDSNVLLDIEVDHLNRGRGFGNYIIRHAQTHGCNFIKMPSYVDPAFENLIKWYAWPDENGIWQMKRQSWPTGRILTISENIKADENVFEPVI